MLARLSELAAQGCQLLIATHSPVLLSLPGATILELGDDGQLRRVGYDEALPVRLTRDFLANPKIYLRHLLDDDDGDDNARAGIGYERS
jgi:predicted ATPase